MRYDELESRYPVFFYHDFSIEENETELTIRYDFETEGLSYFNPEITIRKPYGVTAGDLRSLRVAAFSLGMIELVSYWKLTCSRHVVIECGKLDENQIHWWKKLFYNGLTEFFIQNEIDAERNDFLTMETVGEEIEGRVDHRVFHGNLIPVGGGKDSLVTLDLLKDRKEENHAFVIGHVSGALHAARAAGYDGDSLVIAERSVDPRLLDFNKQGYLNGAVPFSALTAFASALTAIIYGKKYVCQSFEAGDEWSYIKGIGVNQQYSRTFSFEKSFQAYLETYMTPDVKCFSMLRPLSELQTTGIFSRLSQYHDVFRSCDVGMKEEKWCGHCMKCLLVCVLMSAYLPYEKIVSFMHADMLNDSDMLPSFHLLTGEAHKEGIHCHEIIKDANTAVCMAIRNMQERHQEIPILYEDYMSKENYEKYRNSNVSYAEWNHENLVPEEYMHLIEQRLKEMRQ